MRKVVARLFFCAGPAALLGMALLIFTMSTSLALIGFVFVFYFGWQVTECRPDRGEDLRP